MVWKSGSRCPSIGRCSASTTRGSGLDGPGPHSSRSGGFRGACEVVIRRFCTICNGTANEDTAVRMKRTVQARTLGTLLPTTGVCHDARVDEPSEADFRGLSGRWQPFTPREVADLFDGADFPWWIAGGWAAEASGAPARRHEDTDVAVLHADLPAIRFWLSGFHLWEAHAGSLRPLLPGDELLPEREGLWVRRNADSPWVCDLLLTRSRDGQWLFKRGARVSLPIDQLGRMAEGI